MRPFPLSHPFPPRHPPHARRPRTAWTVCGRYPRATADGEQRGSGFVVIVSREVWDSGFEWLWNSRTAKALGCAVERHQRDDARLHAVVDYECPASLRSVLELDYGDLWLACRCPQKRQAAWNWTALDRPLGGTAWLVLGDGCAGVPTCRWLYGGPGGARV